MVDISNRFLKFKTAVKLSPGIKKNKSRSFNVLPNDLCLATDREQFIKTQQSDATLSGSLSAARQQAHVTQPVLYYLTTVYCYVSGGLRCLEESVMWSLRLRCQKITNYKF